MVQLSTPSLCSSWPGDWPPGLASEDDRLRFARYAEALAFHEGDQWLGKRRRGEARLTFNYARTLVRKVAAYVFPSPVTFSISAQSGASPGSLSPQSSDVANRAERALAETIAA